MATVTYQGESYTCSTAIKGADYIHLLDNEKIMVCAFEGITNFNLFTISGGSWTPPTADNECYLAVVREDGTIGKGGHKCSDVGGKVSKNGDTIDGSLTVTGDVNIGGALTVAGKVFNPYAIGCLYISSQQTSPAQIYGGTWTAVEDVFILAAGPTYAAGSTGGEATHTLTIDEMPTHHHSGVRRLNSKYGGGGHSEAESQPSTNAAELTDPTGGDQPHNNMPPYKVYYMWERVA